MIITNENKNNYISASMVEAMEHTTGNYVTCTGDKKTGPVSAWYTSENTCPNTCPFKGNGCYAENFHCHMAWKKATNPLEDCYQKSEEVGLLDLMRLNIAGDLAIPGTSKINLALVDWLIRRFGGRTKAWGYTHCRPDAFNKAVVQYANANGLALSFSVESLKKAQELQAEGVPVVVATDKIKATDNTYHLCQGGKNGVNCRKCRICLNSSREKIVVFNLHGTKAKAARKAVEGIE